MQRELKAIEAEFAGTEADWSASITARTAIWASCTPRATNAG